MTDRGFWTWKPLGVWGVGEGGSTWNPGPSAATQVADITGGRGDYTTAGGGRPTPKPQVPPGGARAVPQIFTEVRPRNSSSDRRKDVGSPVNVLVDTVAQMQQDLANLRAENRLLRTPGVPQVVRACPSTGGVHNDESATVWWDDQLGTIQTGFRRYRAFEWLG